MRNQYNGQLRHWDLVDRDGVVHSVVAISAYAASKLLRIPLGTCAYVLERSVS